MINFPLLPIRSLSALGIAFALTGSHWAEAADVRVSGMGVRKCAEWNQWKEENKGEVRAMTLEWAQGFISGHNIYARTGKDTINSVVIDSKLLAPLLDSYCLKNPEMRILSGVLGIIQNLGGSKVDLAPKTAPLDNPKPDAKLERNS